MNAFADLVCNQSVSPVLPFVNRNSNYLVESAVSSCCKLQQSFTFLGYRKYVQHLFYIFSYFHKLP